MYVPIHYSYITHGIERRLRHYRKERCFMQSSSSNKHSKKRSTSSLSYRSAQNASYRLLDDDRRKKRHSAEEPQSGGHSGSRTKSAVPDNRYDTRNSRPPKRKKN